MPLHHFSPPRQARRRGVDLAQRALGCQHLPALVLQLFLAEAHASHLSQHQGVVVDCVPKGDGVSLRQASQIGLRGAGGRVHRGILCAHGQRWHRACCWDWLGD